MTLLDLLGLADVPRQALWSGLGIPEEPTGVGPVDMGLHALGDPINLALGGALGYRAMRPRTRLESALITYPGTKQEKLGALYRAMEAAPQPDLAFRHNANPVRNASLMRDPEQFLSVVPNELKYLGQGGDAMAFKTPEGDVLKFAWTQPDVPRIDEFLQPQFVLPAPFKEGAASMAVMRQPFVESLASHQLYRDLKNSLIDRGFDYEHGMDIVPPTLRYRRRSSNVGFIREKPGKQSRRTGRAAIYDYDKTLIPEDVETFNELTERETALPLPVRRALLVAALHNIAARSGEVF